VSGDGWVWECVYGHGGILERRKLTYFDRLQAASARKKELTVFLAFPIARVDAVLITLGVCCQHNSGLGRLVSANQSHVDNTW